MKNQNVKWFTVLSLAALLAGCFGSKKDEPGAADTGARDALVAALATQAKNLVSGINKIIIEGDFVAAASPNDRPQPIPLDSDEEVNKAIFYLLANGSSNDGGLTWIYQPDERFCTELVAKNDPTDCVQVMREVRITQEVTDGSSGSARIELFNRRPIELGYSSSGIEVAVDLAELLAVLNEENARLQQRGQRGMGGLPSFAEGRLRSSLGSPRLGAVSFGVAVERALEISGTDSEGGSYHLQVPAAQSLASVSFDAIVRTAQAVLDVPAFEVTFPMKDEQSVVHQLTASFPGLTGTFSLDDAAKALRLSNIQLKSPTISVELDGSMLGQIMAPTELTATAIASSGRFSLTIENSFGMQAMIAGVPQVMEAQGTLQASIDAGTSIDGIGGEQMKLSAGRLQLNGTGDFNFSLDASAPQCVAIAEMPEVVACNP